MVNFADRSLEEMTNWSDARILCFLKDDYWGETVVIKHAIYDCNNDDISWEQLHRPRLVEEFFLNKHKTTLENVSPITQACINQVNALVQKIRAAIHAKDLHALKTLLKACEDLEDAIPRVELD